VVLARLSAMVTNKSVITSFFQAIAMFSKAQNSHTNLNGVRALLQLSRPSSAYLAHNRISRIARI
jgi:hypothetical protein